MRWLIGLPLLPLLICGAMCLIPAVLIALGLRRRDGQPAAPGSTPKQANAGDAELEVGPR